MRAAASRRHCRGERRLTGGLESAGQALHTAGRRGPAAIALCRYSSPAACWPSRTSTCPSTRHRPRMAGTHARRLSPPRRAPWPTSPAARYACASSINGSGSDVAVAASKNGSASATRPWAASKCAFRAERLGVLRLARENGCQQLSRPPRSSSRHECLGQVDARARVVIGRLLERDPQLALGFAVAPELAQQLAVVLPHARPIGVEFERPRETRAPRPEGCRSGTPSTPASRRRTDCPGSSRVMAVTSSNARGSSAPWPRRPPAGDRRARRACADSAALGRRARRCPPDPAI